MNEAVNVNPVDHNFTEVKNFVLEKVASLPAETDSYHKARAVFFNNKPYFLAQVGGNMVFVSWEDIAASGTVTTLTANKDYIVIVNEAGAIKRILLDDMAKKYETKTIYAPEIKTNQYENSVSASEFQEYNTMPYQAIDWIKFPTSVISALTAHANIALPANYDGGALKISYCFVTGGTAITPPKHVFFDIAGRFDQSGVTLNRSLSSDVESETAVLGINTQYITGEVTLTPSTAAAGLGDLHLRIRRECNKATNYPGDVYLRWVNVKYGINKFSS